MVELRVFKPMGGRTASVEAWENGALIAEVFAREEGDRRLYLSDGAHVRGVAWDSFAELAPRITALLDSADAEMAADRAQSSEG